MITVWDVPVVASVEDIVRTLISEVRVQEIPLFRSVYMSSGNLMVTCPEHGNGREKHPSCGISTVDVVRDGKFHPAGTVHCFRCDYTADLPRLISNTFGYRDEGMFGFRWIMSRFVAVEIENRPDLELDTYRNILPRKNFSEGKEDTGTTLSNPSDTDVEKYRFHHAYMYERKLTDKVIDYFDVGFDRENRALTFPVHDLDGRVLFIQRRSVEGKRFLNQDDSDKGSMIYGLHQVYQNLSWIDELWIAESPIDALTCWTHRKAGVALMGALATTTQLRLLRDVPIRKMILALDNDDAGRKGMDKLTKILGKSKIIYRAMIPGHRKDLNDMTPEEFESIEVRLI